MTYSTTQFVIGDIVRTKHKDKATAYEQFHGQRDGVGELGVVTKAHFTQGIEHISIQSFSRRGVWAWWSPSELELVEQGPLKKYQSQVVVENGDKAKA